MSARKKAISKQVAETLIDNGLEHLVEINYYLLPKPSKPRKPRKHATGKSKADLHSSKKKFNKFQPNSLRLVELGKTEFVPNHSVYARQSRKARCYAHAEVALLMAKDQKLTRAALVEAVRKSRADIDGADENLLVVSNTIAVLITNGHLRYVT